MPGDGSQAEAPVERIVRLEGDRLTIGSSNANDVVLEDVNVSRFHAEVARGAGVLELRDLDSKCGTRLNGRPVKRAVIRDGAVIGIGPYRLRFDGSAFAQENERGAMRLEGRDVSFQVDGKRILDRVSLTVEPGELVAIIGASGSGKTTLVKALAGVHRPSAGTVALGGDPITARQTDVGYVPQDEIVHRLLTVDEALRYAARLRLPRDTEPRAVQATIERVLAELELEGQRSTRIDRLSGGERKRASVGSELLNRPSLLFLDEPTTGLDPALESQTMAMLRDLAEPGVRAVVLVTHATRNLSLCDRLIVMAKGGQAVFNGRPDEALRFFEVPSYDGIYDALPQRAPQEWRQRLPQEERPAAPDGREAPEPGPAGSPRAKQRSGSQLGVLVGRYVKLLLRDQRNLLILLGQVPLIAFAIAFLFRTGVFDRGIGVNELPGRPDESVQLLFLLVTTALWFGAIDGSRELVKERAIAAREAHVGVRPGPYLMSKAIVLFTLAAVQTAALAFFVLAVRPLDEPASAYLGVVGLLVLTSFVSVALGLAVSAASSSEDQATSFIPLILIPQLLFAGAIVPVERMAEPINSISVAVFSRWSLAGTGGAIDMEERLRVLRAKGYGDFFAIQPGRVAAILVLFLVVFFVATAVLQARRS